MRGGGWGGERGLGANEEEEERFAANAETIRPSRGEENVGRTECKMERAKKRSQESRGAKEKKEDEERGCGEGREAEKEREREKLDGEVERKGDPVPSYHAASMDPLIFAALRFCLALSTLHTSTADRRHKTLYWSSAERERRRGEREKELRESRPETPRRWLRSIVSNAYGGAHTRRCMDDRATTYIFSTVSHSRSQRKCDKAGQVMRISTSNQTVCM